MDTSDFWQMDYWYTVTVQYGHRVADILVISSGYHNEEKSYIYDRYAAFCYIDSIRDQAIIHIQNHAFLDVINTLKKQYGDLRVTGKKGQMA